MLLCITHNETRKLPTEEITLDTAAGSLSATLNVAEKATHVLLLAHGAGADHLHSHMNALASAFESQKISTLRFNFPFKQEGRNRVDSKAVSIDSISSAAAWLQENTALPLLAGGHSFGGRMATHAIVEKKLSCEALVLCSFPLHPAGKPSKSKERAAHLTDVTIPMFFLSGTRDSLANRDLLDSEIKKLGLPNRIHWLDTGVHSFKILKRSRKITMDIYAEAAKATREFIDEL